MAWLGQFQVGDWMPLEYQPFTSGVAVEPGNQVTARVYNSSGTLVVTINMGSFRPEVETGLHVGRWQVSSVGRGFVIYSEASSVRGVDCFDVEGGHASGNIIAATWARRPEGDYLIFETDLGVMYEGKGVY